MSPNWIVNKNYYVYVYLQQNGYHELQSQIRDNNPSYPEVYYGQKSLYPEDYYGLNSGDYYGLNS